MLFHLVADVSMGHKRVAIVVFALSFCWGIIYRITIYYILGDSVSIPDRY